MLGMHLRRITQIGAFAAVLMAWLSPAYSAARNTCAADWQRAEDLVKNNQLRAAKAWMSKCARAACAVRIRQECSLRVAQIEADIPSVVPVVKDARGALVRDLEMMMDGERLLTQIDGRSVPVDPGDHEFTFRSDRGVLATYKTVILAGQRNRSIEVALRSGGDEPVVRTRVPAISVASATGLPRTPELTQVPYDDEPDSGGKRFTAGTYTLAALGALGVTGYGLMTYWGNKDTQLLDACRPDCKPASVRHIRQLYQGAKIALGVGAAALVGATYLYLTSDSGRTTEMAMSRPRFRLDVQPTPSGGLAAWAGSF